jgi:hypothetical protein
VNGNWVQNWTWPDSQASNDSTSSGSSIASSDSTSSGSSIGGLIDSIGSSGSCGSSDSNSGSSCSSSRKAAAAADNSSGMGSETGPLETVTETPPYPLFGTRGYALAWTLRMNISTTLNYYLVYSNSTTRLLWTLC